MYEKIKMIKKNLFFIPDFNSISSYLNKKFEKVGESWISKNTAISIERKKGLLFLIVELENDKESDQIHYLKINGKIEKLIQGKLF